MFVSTYPPCAAPVMADLLRAHLIASSPLLALTAEDLLWLGTPAGQAALAAVDGLLAEDAA